MRAILTYHSVDSSGSAISISPDVFDEHVNWLTSGRVRVVSLDALLAVHVSATDGRADRIEEIAVTFDDGLASIGPPVRRLLDAGIPAAVFVVTGHVGGTNAWGGRSDPGVPALPLLDWQQLEDFVTRHATIGAHSRTHPRLSTLGEPAIAEEMDGCRADLIARLGVDPAYFAYPYGAVDDRVAGLAARRFAGSFTTRFAAVPAGVLRTSIPRLDMYYFRRPGAIAAFSRPGFHRQLQWIRLRRRVRKALE